MTRRDRLEAKMTRHREWAEKADAKNEAAAQRAGAIAARIPLGQPILFSDDGDAVAQLEARIAERTAELEHRKTINAAFKKAAGESPAAKLAALVANGAMTEGDAADRAGFFGTCHWETRPYPPYAISNLRADIARNVKRLEEVKARQQRAQAAETSTDGVSIDDLGNGYTRATFAEKPARETLDALRAAGYRWGQGSWTGPSASLPESIR